MDLAKLYEHVDLLRAGLTLTLALSAVGIAGSFCVGVAIGVARNSPIKWLSQATSAYIEVMRNVPLVVKLFFLYFVVGLERLPAAIVGLITHQSGFIADVTAAGLRSIPREQAEAGFAT